MRFADLKKTPSYYTGGIRLGGIAASKSLIDLNFLINYFPGIDGSTKHPVFKGKQYSHVFEKDDAAEEEQELKRDPGHCLLSCLVPLKLVGKLPNGQTVVLYKNNLCNSALSGNYYR